MENNSFEVFNKIEKKERSKWHLIIDAIYKANPKDNNLRSEVLSKLLGVKNRGGFRYIGIKDRPKFVVLYSHGKDPFWRDELDNSIGQYLYYGDNKKAGTELHKTNLHGNEILRSIFTLAASDNPEERKQIPPIFVFQQRSSSKDVKFIGLAVPHLARAIFRTSDHRILMPATMLCGAALALALGAADTRAPQPQYLGRRAGQAAGEGQRVRRGYYSVRPHACTGDRAL